MTGIARSRSFNETSLMTGTYLNVSINFLTTRSVTRGPDGTCDDTIGNRTGDNSLGITRRQRIYPTLNGKRYSVTTGALERVMTDFPIGTHPGPIDPRTAFPALTSLQKSNYAWSILSKGNPSAPDVSVFTVVSEMKDIPSLVKNWYKLFALRNPTRYHTRPGGVPEKLTQMLQRLPEVIASGHLTWRWAIAPFIRDVTKMCDFGNLVCKRLKMLQKLRSARSIKRTVGLGQSVSDVVLTNQILHSEGATIKGTARVHYTEKLWGSTRYYAPADFLKDIAFLGNPNSVESARLRFQLAKRLVYGITTHEAMATAWELLPWSWFADWFLNVGQVINATNNTLGLTHSDSCLMRHTTSTRSIDVNPALSDAWVLPLTGEYTEVFERKERFIVAPLLPLAPTYLPILSWKAVSILGSLAVTKWRPGRNLNTILGPPV